MKWEEEGRTSEKERCKERSEEGDSRELGCDGGDVGEDLIDCRKREEMGGVSLVRRVAREGEGGDEEGRTGGGDGSNGSRCSSSGRKASDGTGGGGEL